MAALAALASKACKAESSPEGFHHRMKLRADALNKQKYNDGNIEDEVRKHL